MYPWQLNTTSTAHPGKEPTSCPPKEGQLPFTLDPCFLSTPCEFDLSVCPLSLSLCGCRCYPDPRLQPQEPSFLCSCVCLHPSRRPLLFLLHGRPQPPSNSTQALHLSAVATSNLSVLISSSLSSPLLSPVLSSALSCLPNLSTAKGHPCSVHSQCPTSLLSVRRRYRYIGLAPT